MKLLMTIVHSGLTLVAAQTVFMVEPVFNEALEQQAISRVDRIGQTKEVGKIIISYLNIIGKITLLTMPQDHRFLVHCP
jgi:hypothetical protein